MLTLESTSICLSLILNALQGTINSLNFVDHVVSQRFEPTHNREMSCAQGCRFHDVVALLDKVTVPQRDVLP